MDIEPLVQGIARKAGGAQGGGTPPWFFLLFNLSPPTAVPAFSKTTIP